MLKSGQMKNLFVKKRFLDLILANKKSIEVRVCYPFLKTLKAGDRLFFNRQYPYKIKRISKYKNFRELLKNEDPDKIYPGKSKEELLKELKRLYPPKKETLGVMAIEIKAVSYDN